MPTEMYGDTPDSADPPVETKAKPKRKTKALQEAPKKKVEVEGYVLRVQAMGSMMDIVSPIPRDQFVEEMVDTINEKGADPMWSGWYHLKKVDGKTVSVRLRSIDTVEEM
jgi:hypothetical protein|tara:strand:+ start:215 stop:544 length:330 start_codon:yes stop_codon:yes gene_type:complete